MGTKNYLVEGVSGTGKTSVCEELQRRGYHAIHGDRELAYQGDPRTGEPLDGVTHEHHIWDVAKVRNIAGDQRQAVTFFCGGSRNFERFIDLFDQIFVLEIDRDTLHQRLSNRPPSEWGGTSQQRTMIMRLHETRADVPSNAVEIDATVPITRVVDDILSRCI
ncbi:MAG: AAA family ATPase [Sphingopyxis sp.]|nr:AAA family ATPase [Sphingopyxis sp.]